MGLYLGASTTSGPNRNMKIEFVSDSHIEHEQAWYAEPFVGTYNHQFMIYPFEKSWQESQAPSISRSYTQEVYTREFHASPNSGNLPSEKSLISLDQQNVEITSMEIIDGKLQVRLNEKTGRESDVVLSLGDKKKKEESLKVLERAAGFLQHEVGTALQMRYTPKLQFEFQPGNALFRRKFQLVHTLFKLEFQQRDALVASGQRHIHSLESLGHSPPPVFGKLCQCFLDFGTKERVWVRCGQNLML
jgi:hypothetical protein